MSDLTKNSDSETESAQASMTLRRRADKSFQDISELLVQLGIKDEAFELYGATIGEAIERLKKRVDRQLHPKSAD